MKQLFLLLISFCIALGKVQAQDFQYNFQATQVKFSGAGSIAILEDSLATVYSTAHWRNTGLREPAGFASGSKMSATANFEFYCTKAPDSICIRGLGNDTINFPLQTVALTPGSGLFTCTYPISPASKAFPAGIVNYYAPFNITWQISFDKGLTWLNADTTDHKIYVTKSAPMAQTTNFKYFHTLLELSCKNAIGQTTDTGIISSCWSEFLDHVVLNYKGDSLFYYKTFNTPYTTLPNLLRYRNAECYTFAQLFLSLIKIQGVVLSNNYVYITPRNDSAFRGTTKGIINRFLVKNWKLGSKSDSSACPSFPYRNTYSGSYITPTGYVFTTADVNDQKGIDGQCNPNPSSFFNNHQISKIGGIYYDACYGVTFKALTDIKTSAFDGWGVSFSSGTYNFTTDMSKTDLAETITTF